MSYIFKHKNITLENIYVKNKKVNSNINIWKIFHKNQT